MPVPKFALHDLGWQAFQQLGHTVLREVLGQAVVSFLDTSDAGRDGAFEGTWTTPRSGPSAALTGRFVVQCKHTARPGATLNVGGLKDEFSKVAALVAAGRCDAYVLMTNAGLLAPSAAAIEDRLRSLGVKHTLILGATWFNQTIAESPRLRRLVPRLYGLGDLTQILDARAYGQSRAVLDAMRSDLDKLVLTATYQHAAHALEEHGFVLLAGAAATGKTTIAAQLALGSADEFDTAVVKLSSIDRLDERWNPDENQLFWLDDAFGATQFERAKAWSWTAQTQQVASALKAGSRFVLTSRDYVYNAANPYLKAGSFPLLDEAKVVVDVADLAIEERQQILYNHLRHGRQANDYLDRLAPHLDDAAKHPGFTPELARRLADPVFTTNLVPSDSASVDAFFAGPSEFLAEVMRGLDADARAALGLIFVHHDWLPSPVELNNIDQDLVARLGSDLGGVTSALAALNNSLVRHLVREGEGGWVFAHPTMVDAYADLLRSPELMHHLLTGFPVDVLLSEITCGDVGVQNAVIVPRVHYDLVLSRLNEPLRGDWRDRWAQERERTSFLTTRCDRAFLERWTDRNIEVVRELRPGLMLEADHDNELAARLNELRLLPEPTRRAFAEGLSAYCLSGEDPAVLHSRNLRSLLTDAEWSDLLPRVRDELLADPVAAVAKCVEHWSPGEDAAAAAEPLQTLVWELPELFPGDLVVAARTADLERVVGDWVSLHTYSDGEEGDALSHRGLVEAARATRGGESRSVFDDLTKGRAP